MRGEFVKAMLQNQTGSHVFECIMDVASPSMLTNIYNEFLAGHLAEWSRHGIVNYVIQRFFSRCKEPALLERAVKELAPSLGDVLFAKSRVNVAVKLLEAVVPFESIHGVFFAVITLL